MRLVILAMDDANITDNTVGIIHRKGGSDPERNVQILEREWGYQDLGT